jgi:hypothetical protein
MTDQERNDRYTIEWMAAMAFVVLGGLFWMAATFAAMFMFHDGGRLMTWQNALLPLALTLIVLAVGWYFEYAATALVAVVATGVVAWGVVSGWEPGVWMIMLSTLVAPMVISGLLFFLAGRMREHEPIGAKLSRFRAWAADVVKAEGSAG